MDQKAHILPLPDTAVTTKIFVLFQLVGASILLHKIPWFTAFPFLSPFTS